MEEIVVEKRGSWNGRHWSQRMLSISTVLGLATVSQQGHVEDCHRKCVHLTSVQMWPNYNKKHIHGDFNAMEAKLTLRVKGFAVRLGERVVNGENGPQRVFHYTQRNCGSDARAWMLRFATFDDHERAVHLFQSIEVKVKSKATTEGSQTQAVECHNEAAKGEDECGGAAAAAATAEAAEEGDATVTACVRRHRDDPPLSDDLDAAGVAPSPVMEGDVASHLAFIRSEWEQKQRGAAAVA